MNSHHVFHWLFALFFVCASITQSKAIAQPKCSAIQFQASEGMKQMKHVIGFGDVAQVKGLLARGFDLTEAEIEELLRSGADVNIKAKDDHTALSLVKREYIENSRMEHLLRQFGARE